MTNRIFVALAVLLALVGAVAKASAAVHVRVAVSDPKVPVLSENTYTVTVTADEPAQLHTVKLLLPGHGAPPISEDVYGQPRDTDDDTQFAVLDPGGATQSGRWLTWDVSDVLLPGGTITRVAYVRTPPAEAWLQAGAWATTTDHTPVDGTKRGAQIWNHQDTASLHTGGSATIANRDVTITWWMANGTDAPLTIDTERFGVRAGAAYDGSTLDPVAKTRHVNSLGLIWHHPITLDPGQLVEHTVHLTSGCGIGQMGARLRIYAGGLLAGTGAAGPHWKLPDCPAGTDA